MIKENVDELDKLVSMAEDVSETVNELHAKIANLKVMFMLSVLGLYGALGASYYLIRQPKWLFEIPLALYSSLIILAVLIGLGSVFYIYQYATKTRVYKRSLNAEKDILHRLLDMVHEYKENIHSAELSYVEKAILEMKLKRIKYSSKW